MALKTTPWTVKEIQQLLDYSRRDIELTTGLYAAMLGAKPMPRSEPKWPTRFFELHKEKMREAAATWDDGYIFQMTLRESWDEQWLSDCVYFVNVRIKHSERGVHMIPASE